MGMNVPDEDRFDEVLDVLTAIKAIDGVIVAGYEVQVSNPGHTGVQITVGIDHTE